MGETIKSGIHYISNRYYRISLYNIFFESISEDLFLRNDPGGRVTGPGGVIDRDF